jgi:hypothetical protein
MGRQRLTRTAARSRIPRSDLCVIAPVRSAMTLLCVVPVLGLGVCLLAGCGDQGPCSHVGFTVYPTATTARVPMRRIGSSDPRGDLCGLARVDYCSASRRATISPVACGCSAVGSASPCQGEGRGFESRHPLGGATASTPAVEWPSGEATACKAVHTGSIPVSTSENDPGAISSAGERFPDTEEVTGSIPVSRTIVLRSQARLLPGLRRLRAVTAQQGWRALVDKPTTCGLLGNISVDHLERPGPGREIAAKMVGRRVVFEVDEVRPFARECPSWEPRR